MVASGLAREAAAFLDLGVLGYTLAFVAAFAEALPGIGFFVPGQWVAVAAGFASEQGYYALPLMLGLVVLGGFAGDAVAYLLGRHQGRAVLERYGSSLRVKPENVQRLQRLIDDYGPVALVLARFTMVTRSLGPLIAGVNRMRPAVFWPVNVLGAIVWGATYVVLGYAFGESTELLARALGGTAVVIAALGVAAFGVAWLVARRRRRARN